MKKILIISGSPRKNGNSDTLCNEFSRGATESGYLVEKISLSGKKIGYCVACDYCVSHNGECAFKDDVPEIVNKMIAADIIVLASPVYFYSVDAQIKAVIDRCVCKYTKISNKDLYYILTAAEEDDTTFNGSLACFRGFKDCLNGSEEKGMILAGGVWQVGDVNKTSIMNDAYLMGKNA